MANNDNIFETKKQGKIVILSDMIKEFRRYSSNHPLKMASDYIFDENGNIIKDKIWRYCNIINSYNSICIALQTLYQRDVEVYKDFVLNKLKAEDSQNGYNKQRLISALAEIAVIFNFTNSYGWTDFVYENKINDTSSKNVDFTITYPEQTFHIEIKTFDLQDRHKKLKKSHANGDYFIEINNKLSNESFQLVKTYFKERVVHSIDDRVENFVKDALPKFPNSKKRKESNVLLFNYNEKIEQINACLLKKNVGCLSKLNSSNILDFVVSTSLYTRIEYYLEVLQNPSLLILMLPDQSPFYMHFCKWSIIDANQAKDHSFEHDILSKICFNAPTCTQYIADQIPDSYIYKGESLVCNGDLSNMKTP